jgi:hypothetical protein
MARLTGLDDATLKEQFSVTYVRAVAYAAGAVVDESKVDRDSIDVVIRAKGQVGPKRSPSVDAQLKCHTGELNAQGELVYDLPIKNYRDLIPSNHLVPRILIVVAVPEDVADHAAWTPEQLVLRRCGYWKHLGGQPQVANSTKVRVKLTQPFSPDALVSIFHDIASGVIT